MNPVRPKLLIVKKPPDPWLRHVAELAEATDLLVADSREAAEHLLPEAEVVFSWVGSAGWLRDFWGRARRLKWIQSGWAGVEYLLFPELVESPVVLTNASGAYARALAEFVIFCALFFAKRFPFMERNRRERRWQRYQPADAHGQTIGIVGFGGTGRATARLAKSLGMRVVATKRTLPAAAAAGELADELIPLDRWHDLLAGADHVVNALPLTAETRGMFGEAEFRAMQQSASFINVGRGPTVREEALVRALREGWIGGAGLDVFETEPLPATSELYSLPNVIVSPHCADETPSFTEHTARLLVDNVRRYLQGEPLRNVVDKQRGY